MLARQLLYSVLILMLATGPVQYAVAAVSSGQGHMQHCSAMTPDAAPANSLTDVMAQHAQHCQHDQGKTQQHNCGDDCSMCGSCAHHGSMVSSEQPVSRLLLATSIEASTPDILVFQPDLNLRPPI